MNKLFFTVVALTFAVTSYAADDAKLKSLAKKGRGSKVKITKVDTEVREGVNVDKAALKRLRTRFPSAETRDAAFAEAGIDSLVSSWSDYDKDMLALRGKEFSADQFASSYPDFDAPTRSKLQAALKK